MRALRSGWTGPSTSLQREACPGYSSPSPHFKPPRSCVHAAAHRSPSLSIGARVAQRSEFITSLLPDDNKGQPLEFLGLGTGSPRRQVLLTTYDLNDHDLHPFTMFSLPSRSPPALTPLPAPLSIRSTTSRASQSTLTPTSATPFWYRANSPPEAGAGGGIAEWGAGGYVGVLSRDPRQTVVGRGRSGSDVHLMPGGMGILGTLFLAGAEGRR